MTSHAEMMLSGVREPRNSQALIRFFASDMAAGIILPMTKRRHGSDGMNQQIRPDSNFKRSEAKQKGRPERAIKQSMEPKFLEDFAGAANVSIYRGNGNEKRHRPVL